MADDSSPLEAAFAKIRTQTNSGVPAVRRPATLLLAIENTLTSQQSTSADADAAAQLPPQAYLVALLSTLSQLTTTAAASQAGEKRELLEATLYLLSLLTPHLDPSLLRSKAAVLSTLQALFPSFQTHAPALKSLIAIAQALLASLAPQQLEKDLAARSVFASILALTNDARPKVRRRAQEAITALLSAPPPPAVVHPYGAETASWILDKLEEAVKGAKRGGKKQEVVEQKKGKGKGEKEKPAIVIAGEENQGSDESRAIALLVFIKNLGNAWNDASTPQLLPTLLSTLTLSSPHLTLSALTLLSHLFSAAREADSISANSVKETLEALIAAKPKGGEGENSEKLTAGWIEGVGEGMVAFARTEPTGALAQTSVLFPSVLPILASATTPVLRQAVATSLDLMIRHTITDAEIIAALDLERPTAAKGKDKSAATSPDVPGSALVALIDLVDKALTSPRYAANSLPHVLGLAKSLFFRLRLRPSSSSSTRPLPAATSLLGKTLVLVGKMREDERFEWKREAEGVLDAAIKVSGPEWVLSTMPLGLEEGANPTRARAWLLPLLKPSITNTRLGHFREYFVPLSAEMFAKAEKARAGDKGMEAKVWETLVGQIWSLLPGYCEYPTDLVAAFDNSFVSLLGTVLYSQASLRPSIFRSLSTILASATSLASSASPPELLQAQFGLTPAEGKVALAHLKAMAPSILGVAFNVYGMLPRGEGAYVLTTVADWFAVLEPKEVQETYGRMETLLKQALAEPYVKPGQKGHGAPVEKDDTIPTTHSLLDILIALIPYAGPVEKQFFDLALSSSVLGSQDQAVQKKGYRILARLAEERNGKVVEGRIGDVVDALVENASVVAQGAKRDRTLLLSTLVPLLPADSLHHIPSLIPEAVLGTKESNERTREAAYELIVGMGRKMGEGGEIHRNKVKGMEDGMEDVAKATLEEFITMVSAGLAGSSPHMISATITSLSRLVFEFHAELPRETLSELLTTLIIFLSSANREIVRSAIGYVKVAIVSLPGSLVEPSLPALIPALINWSHEHSNHFKVKIRHILERLVRKFGIDKIEREVPEDDRKLVQNIRKRQMRSKKKKEANQAAEEDAEMDDGEAAPRPQAATRSAYDEVLYGSDSDISASDDDDRGAAASAPKTANRKSMMRKKKQEEGAYLHEDEDEVLDLLDDRMMSRISAARPAPAAAARKPLASHFKTDETGRMKIAEDESDEDVGTTAEAMGAYLEAMRGEDGHTRDAKGRAKFNKTQGKRSRADEDEEDVPVTEGLKELEVSGKRNKKFKKDSVRVGGDFKAKNAGGDVHKGGMQPYAFVPLSSVAGKKKNQRTDANITGHKRSGKGGNNKAQRK
ncbi:ribosomal rna-processing protein 12 [Pseudohyphozyma bogoriensis]|nr:ribosomal rna-processing protein 12 [Pseudohyphozyma bogoriensis]